MDTTMEKRMRKRMNMIENERDRVFRSQFGTISSVKSFDEIKDEREAALRRDFDDSPDDERDSECDSSVMAGSISELRRRRVHEMTYNRPFPTKSTKKKHNFWQLEEELPRPAVLLSPSFSKLEEPSSVLRMRTPETSSIDSDGLDDEKDEIMTPVKAKKDVNVYDDEKNNGMERIYRQIDLVRPIVNEATVSEISTATKAMSVFATSAAAVMKEAKTPEKNDREYESYLERFGKVISESQAEDEGCDGAVIPFNALKLFKDTAKAVAATPAGKLMTKIPTPMTTKTMDSSVDEAEIMATKLNDAGQVVEKVEDGALWPSLFIDPDSGLESSIAKLFDNNQMAMLKALVQGGALHREIDGKNTLKLFVDMYQKETFEKIVSAVKELKGLHGLVICRALDKNRSTYRSSQEIMSLFDATREIHQLDSLTLLNFDSDSLTNLPMMIQEQPLLYRLQIQLIEGTLNGELLGVMATAPRLTHVSFDLKESCSLGTLMNSKTLESVCLNSRDLEMKKSHLRTLIYSLQTNFTLTTLDLGAAISIEQFQSLCVALRQNFRLESLRVNLELNTEEESSIVARELANLFRENTYLLNVWNYSHQSCDISAESMRDILEALRGNRSMQEFKFFSEDIGDWKDIPDKNPFWMKRNLSTPGTDASTACEPTEDFDQSASFFSRTSAVLSDQSLQEDLNFCGIDCSTLSPPIDCSKVSVKQLTEKVSVKDLTAKFQNWAGTTNKDTTIRRTMEV